MLAFCKIICFFLILEYNSTLISKRGGDSFYMRALSDFSADAGGSPVSQAELSYARGDILFVDSTVHGGRVGIWHAWQLDAYGNCTGARGILPSIARYTFLLLLAIYL